MIEGVKVEGADAGRAVVAAATALLAGGPASMAVPPQPVSSKAAPMDETDTATKEVLPFIL
ncbi:hypothetical protein IU448_02650 [Nocardia flavorosea]|uniref:hypothetical protein n=1 Tax=Nocardia flavorosea TaxID=53429 RepID=UPI00189584AE|nr:hypothetical protein [Nocardia flavorosea]MBF6347911.1 hypothetical protein [Nocardia flavorosea]